MERLLVQKHTFLRALLNTISRHPHKAAALLAVTEIPMSLKNYPWSITEAPISYMVAAQVVMQLPYSFFVINIGAASGDMMDVLHGKQHMTTGHIVFTVIGLLLGLGAFVLVGIYTKHELNQMIAERDHDDFDDGSSEGESDEAPAAFV